MEGDKDSWWNAEELNRRLQPRPELALTRAAVERWQHNIALARAFLALNTPPLGCQQAKAKAAEEEEEDFPELAVMRWHAVKSLERLLQQLCKNHGLPSAPSCAFSRWCFTQKMVEPHTRACDPLLPAFPCLSSSSSSPVSSSLPSPSSSPSCSSSSGWKADPGLYHELLKQGLSVEAAQDICLKLSEAVAERATALASFREGEKRKEGDGSRGDECVWKEIRAVEPPKQEEEVVIGFADHSFSICRSHYEKLVRLYAAGLKVDDVIKQRFVLSMTRNERLNGGANRSLQKKKGKEQMQEQEEAASDKEQERDAKEQLEYCTPTHTRNEESQHEADKHDQTIDPLMDDLEEAFLRRLFCMVARYEGLGGEGFQAALPKEAFAFLQAKLGVSHECFASPLNCSLPFGCYSSAFPDVDRFFGSRGNFFREALFHGWLSSRHETSEQQKDAESDDDSDILEGSFQANPPFLEETMLALALCMERWLDCAEKRQRPLSFAVFVPGWKDTPSYQLMADSFYLTKKMVLAKHQHAYLPGFQHRPSRRRPISYSDTFVFFLQSSAAAARWPISDSMLRSFSALLERSCPQRSNNHRQKTASKMKTKKMANSEDAVVTSSRSQHSRYHHKRAPRDKG
ncbi:mRNA (2'-O-methyladenosine-N(6)-)-methyltransferase [Balamuthia mandrillaris]